LEYLALAAVAVAFALLLAEVLTALSPSQPSAEALSLAALHDSLSLGPYVVASTGEQVVCDEKGCRYRGRPIRPYPLEERPWWR